MLWMRYGEDLLIPVLTVEDRQSDIHQHKMRAERDAIRHHSLEVTDLTDLRAPRLSVTPNRLVVLVGYNRRHEYDDAAGG